MSDTQKQQLKELLIEALNLDDTVPEDLADDQPLMESGLGLDSIDMLELVVRVEKTFSIKIRNSEEARDALQSIHSLDAFIRKKQVGGA